MTDKTEIQTPATVPDPPQQQLARSAEETAYSLLIRKARALASSTLVPESYRGEDNLGNVFIALDVAERIGASPTAVMQSLHVIHGRPSWSASFLIGTVNACGRFTPLRFETIGTDPADKDYRVRAVAKDRESGDVCEGPWITWGMVKAEGWSEKKGSKWLSMPALMFMYRAAAFWTRVYAPELSLGIQTADEVIDVHEAKLIPARADLSELEGRLKQRAIAKEDPVLDPEPAEPTGEVTDLQRVVLLFQEATTIDELNSACEKVADLETKEERLSAMAAYEDHQSRIEAAFGKV